MTPTRAVDGVAALTELTKEVVWLNVVLFDVFMPTMPGLEQQLGNLLPSPRPASGLEFGL